MPKPTIKIRGLDGLSPDTIFELGIALKLAAKNMIGRDVELDTVYLFPMSQEAEINWVSPDGKHGEGETREVKIIGSATL